MTITFEEGSYLGESDFNIQGGYDHLKEKLVLIKDFVSLAVLDLSDDDLDTYYELMNVVNTVRHELFNNSDEILKSRDLEPTDPVRISLYDRQETLMKSWNSFGLSESMFHKLYQTHHQSFTNKSEIVRGGADTLFSILLEQVSLILIFYKKQQSNVVYDVENYL